VTVELHSPASKKKKKKRKKKGSLYYTQNKEKKTDRLDHPNVPDGTRTLNCRLPDLSNSILILSISSPPPRITDDPATLLEAYPDLRPGWVMIVVAPEVVLATGGT